MLAIVRMCRSGQNWTQPAVRAVMDLLALDKSGHFEAAWEYANKSARRFELTNGNTEAGLKKVA